MTEDEAFLAAIQANPADDLARLVYADWLDERGDPRGEWLRIHVQLKQLVADGRLYFPLENRQSCLEDDAEIDPTWRTIVSRPAWTGAEIRDWQEFYNAIRIRPGGPEEPLPKPTVAQLDRYEAETDFRLPQSYRDYLLVFGPGRLLTDWDIAAPGYAGEGLYDLHTLHVDWSNWLREQHGYRYFCSKYKDAFYWDPAEVTDPDTNEYAVYRIIEDGRVVRIADTFRGFVENALLEMLTHPRWDEVELGSPLRFEPAARRTEAPPAASEQAGGTA